MCFQHGPWAQLQLLPPWSWSHRKGRLPGKLRMKAPRPSLPLGLPQGFLRAGREGEQSGQEKPFRHLGPILYAVPSQGLRTKPEGRPQHGRSVA